MDNYNNLRIYTKEKIMANAIPKINSQARAAFERAKATLLDEFEAHPVTRALRTHSGIDGLDSAEGTLFGFIGFDAGENPADELRDMLIEGMDFGAVRQSGPSTIYVSYSLPDKEEIFEKTPLRWAEGRSWVEMLETGGIPGVGQYLGIMGKGYSQEGIQVKSKIRQGKFGPMKYLSNFLNNADKKIRQKLNEELILA